MAAKAPADGYTLLLISVAFAFNPSMYKLPYDPATAFAPVAALGVGPVVVAVTGKLPVNSLQELLALAKSKPGTLNYATAGIGSFQHSQPSSSSTRRRWRWCTCPSRAAARR